MSTLIKLSTLIKPTCLEEMEGKSWLLTTSCKVVSSCGVMDPTSLLPATPPPPPVPGVGVAAEETLSSLPSHPAEGQRVQPPLSSLPQPSLPRLPLAIGFDGILARLVGPTPLAFPPRPVQEVMAVQTG